MGTKPITVTIDDVLISKYILAIDSNSLYSRYIFKVSDIRLVDKTDSHEEYAMTASNKRTYQLYHDTISGKLTIYYKSRLLSVVKAVTDFIPIIAEGDTIVYHQANAPPFSAKIVKYQEKYRRFILEIFGERHNLSTLLKRYGTANIYNIITDDMRRAK